MKFFECGERSEEYYSENACGRMIWYGIKKKFEHLVINCFSVFFSLRENENREIINLGEIFIRGICSEVEFLFERSKTVIGDC